MPGNKQNTIAEQRPPSRDLRVLKQLFTLYCGCVAMMNWPGASPATSKA
jgi:hypothetical protein